MRIQPDTLVRSSEVSEQLVRLILFYVSLSFHNLNLLDIFNQCKDKDGIT